MDKFDEYKEGAYTFSINVNEGELIDSGDNWISLVIDRIVNPTKIGGRVANIGDMSANEFESLNWQLLEQGGSTVLFKAEKDIPEQLVPCDMFWNDEKGELVLPKYAENKITMATKISDLSQVGFIKLKQHKETHYLLCWFGSSGSWASHAWLK